MSLKFLFKTYLDKDFLFKVSEFFLLKVVGVASMYFFAWWISTRYGAAKWGFITTCLILINILGVLSLLGFDVYAIKHLSYDERRENAIGFHLRAIVPILIVAVGISGLILLFLEPLSIVFFSSIIDAPWLKVVALALPFYAIYYFGTSSLAGLKEYFWFGFFRNTFSISMACVLSMAVFGITLSPYFEGMKDSGIIYLLLFVAALIIGGLLMLSFIFFKSTQRNLVDQNESTVSLLRSANPLHIYAVMSLLVVHGDLLLLSLMKGEAMVGYYDIAVKLSLFVYTLAIAFNGVLPIKLAEYIKMDGYDKVQDLSLASSRFLFLSSLVVFLAIVLLSDQMLLFFGDEFIAVKSVLIVLAIAQFISCFAVPAVSILKMADSQNTLRNIMIFAGLFNLVLNFILIRQFGLVGAAFATLCTTIIWNGLCIYYVKKAHNVTAMYIPFLTKYELIS